MAVTEKSSPLRTSESNPHISRSSSTTKTLWSLIPILYLPFGCWKINPKLRPLPYLTFHLNPSLMILDNALAYCQTKSSPLVLLCCEKRIENSLHHFLLHPHPRILHAHLHILSLIIFKALL